MRAGRLPAERARNAHRPVYVMCSTKHGTRVAGDRLWRSVTCSYFNTGICTIAEAKTAQCQVNSYNGHGTHSNGVHTFAYMKEGVEKRVRCAHYATQNTTAAHLVEPPPSYAYYAAHALIVEWQKNGREMVHGFLQN